MSYSTVVVVVVVGLMLGLTVRLLQYTGYYGTVHC